MPMLVIVSAPGPLLVTVTTCAALVVFTVWFPKPKGAGDKPTAGPIPVPLKLTGCEPPTLSLITRVAVRAPAAAGVKVTLIAQPACGVRMAGQLLVSAKSPALAPVMLAPAKVKSPKPVLEKVTLWAVLVVPIFSAANERELVERFTDGQLVMQTFTRKASPDREELLKEEQLSHAAWYGISVGKLVE